MASEPDTAFLQQLREQSTQAFANAALAPAAPTLWRKIMHNRTIGLAAAAAVLMAALLGIFLFQGTSQSLYADVAEMLQQTRTLVYTLVTQANDGSGRSISTRWFFKDPAYLRTETEGGHVTVIDGVQGKQMSLVPENMTYMTGDFELLDKEGDGTFAAVATLRALPAQANEVLEEKELDGRRVQGFRVNIADGCTTVWIDVDTRDLVQAEYAYTSAPGMNTIMKDFEFDVDLPDDFFALAPPEGYTLNVTLDAGTGGSEQQFVDYLRYWSTELPKDGTFPPVVLGPQMSKVMVDMAMQGKLHNDKLQQVNPNDMYQALLWLAQLPKESNWRYVGEGIPHGDAGTPVFWYRPQGQSRYRVVYADLSIREVLPEDLPQ